MLVHGLQLGLRTGSTAYFAGRWTGGVEGAGSGRRVPSTQYSVKGTGENSALSTLNRLEADIKALTEIIPLGGGSNNWVIAPKRSATGRPIVCNDPHLLAQVPAPWYLVSIRTPDWSVASASFIGAPAIACGHNGHAAWGVTAGLSDNSDLFVEQVRHEGGVWQYRQGEQWLPCGVRKEVIHLKKGEPVTEEILSTPSGPIISPILNDTPEALSLRAVWLDPLPLDGWLSAMKAKSFSEFREWPGFPMNLVYADATGKTAWQFVGQIPVRKRGHGMLPRPAGMNAMAGRRILFLLSRCLSSNTRRRGSSQPRTIARFRKQAGRSWVPIGSTRIGIR